MKNAVSDARRRQAAHACQDLRQVVATRQRPVRLAVHATLCLLTSFVASCGGGSGASAGNSSTAPPAALDPVPSANQTLVRPTLAASVPAAAQIQISQFISEIDSKASGAALLAPQPASAAMPSVVMATNSEGKIMLAGIGAGSLNLGADSTAVALVRVLVDKVPTTEAELQAAIRAASHFASLVSAINSELAAGRSPADSTDVATAALRVVSDLATRFASTAQSGTVQSSTDQASANADGGRVQALATTASVTMVSGPLPYPLVDYAPYCTTDVYPCWSKLMLVGGDADGATMRNGLPIAWALRTQEPTGAVLQEAVVDGAEDALPTRDEMKIKTIRGNAVRFNLTAYQSEESVKQNLRNVVIDIFKAGLMPLGAWVPNSRQCLVPLADIVLNQTGLAQSLADTSTNSGVSTVLSDYFTEQKFTELAEPLKGAAECMGASFESRAMARFLLSRTFWGKTVLKALPVLGQTYVLAQTVGSLATSAVRYYATISEASTRKTVQICLAPSAGIVNCPVRYELTPNPATPTAGQNFSMTAKAYDSGNIETLPPAGLVWKSDHEAIVAPLSTGGDFKAVAFGSAVVSVEDPYLPSSKITATVNVQYARGLTSVMISGNVEVGIYGSADCAGIFAGPRFTNGSIDPNGILGGMPFTLIFTIDSSKGIITTSAGYSNIGTPSREVPLSEAPITSAVLTIAQRSIDFAQMSPLVYPASATTSRNPAPTGTMAYVAYDYGIFSGSRAGSRLSAYVADDAFLGIFSPTADFTLPFNYGFTSPNARQLASFTIKNNTSNNNGCGTLSAQGYLDVRSITVTR